MIEVGDKAPGFSLPDHEGQLVSLSDFEGRRLLIVFFPLAFSPVCCDQLTSYKKVQKDLDEAGVTMIGISVDSAFAHKAFRDQLNVKTSLLADFEPKGEVAKAYGAYLDDWGHSNRSLVLIDGEGVVEWVHVAETPVVIPPPSLILKAL